MIRIWHGQTRSGKSYHMFKDGVEELGLGDRYVATNLTIFDDKLHALLDKRYPDAKVDLHKRLRILTTEEAMEFWLHPAPGVDLVGPTIEQQRKGVHPDLNPFVLSNPQGTLFMIDEAQVLWDARGWMKTGPSLSFVCQQHAKLNWEIGMTCQVLKQLESRIVDLGNQWIHCENHALQMVFNWFRKPNRMKTSLHSSKPPSTADRVTYEKIDVELANCYDASAGVGIRGRRTVERKDFKGISLWWLSIPVILLIWGLSNVDTFLTYGVNKITGATDHAAKAAIEPSRSLPVQSFLNTPRSYSLSNGSSSLINDRHPGIDSRSVKLSPDAFKDAELTGYIQRGKTVNFVFSDGTVLSRSDPEMTRFRLDGHTLRLNTGEVFRLRERPWSATETEKAAILARSDRLRGQNSVQPPTSAPPVSRDAGAWIVGADGVSRLKDSASLSLRP